mgnify:CR=1 FL=1|jgi:hypothetical protein
MAHQPKEIVTSQKDKVGTMQLVNFQEINMDNLCQMLVQLKRLHFDPH